MNTEQERADFEAACDLNNIRFTRQPDGTYFPNPAQHRWEGWHMKAALQSQEYISAIGEAGQAYLDRFKNAHALPAEFRWSELWAVMCVAANKGRTEATQSQDREDAERYRWLRDGGNDDMGVVRGFDCIDCGSTAVAGTYEEGLEGEQLDAAIDHARRIEGES